MDIWPPPANSRIMNAILFDTLRLSRTLRDKGHFTLEQPETLAEAWAMRSTAPSPRGFDVPLPAAPRRVIAFVFLPPESGAGSVWITRTSSVTHHRI